MPMPEHLHPECPPDAHKVIRPEENKVFATLCVYISEEELNNGIGEVCDIISRMSKKPLLQCSEKVKKAILEKAADFEIEPGFVTALDGNKATVSYADGSVGPTQDYVKLEFADASYKEFLDLLSKKTIISIDVFSMFIMRSLSTIYPWDKLLANHFLNQYLTCAANVTEEDKKLLRDFRYGRLDPYENKEKSVTAYEFLRLERKLFLQYPTEDD